MRRFTFMMTSFVVFGLGWPDFWGGSLHRGGWLPPHQHHGPLYVFPQQNVHVHTYVSIPEGPAFNLGVHYRGRAFRHWIFGSNWTGWTYRQWYPSYGSYIYWAPAYNMWYRWQPADRVFVPCDEWSTTSIYVPDDDPNAP